MAARTLIRLRKPTLRLAFAGAAAATCLWVSATAAGNPIADPYGMGKQRAEGQRERSVLLCQAPCEISLPKRRLKLAIAQPGGEPVSAGSVTIDKDLALKGKYYSASGVNALGWVFLIGGPVTGDSCWPLEGVRKRKKTLARRTQA